MENNYNNINHPKQDEHVSFKQAVLLKEKGFDYLSDAFYHEDDELQLPTKSYPLNYNHMFLISAPTYSLVRKWMRNEKHIHISIASMVSGTEELEPDGKYSIYLAELIPNTFSEELLKEINSRLRLIYFDSYELAESAGIDEVLKII